MLVLVQNKLSKNTLVNDNIKMVTLSFKINHHLINKAVENNEESKYKQNQEGAGVTACMSSTQMSKMKTQLCYS